MLSLVSICSKHASASMEVEEESVSQGRKSALKPGLSLSVLDYDYSNTLPKVKKICSKKLPVEKQLWIEDKASRHNITADVTRQILVSLEYSPIPGAVYLSRAGFMHLYTKGKEVLAVLCHYNHQSCRLNLRKIDDCESNINRLSWNHLSKALKTKVNPKRIGCRHTPIRKASVEDLAVLDMINKRGTIKFIKRLVAVTNPKGSYNFYAVYDTQRELNKVKNTIKKL